MQILCEKNIINQLFIRLQQQIHTLLERWIPSRKQPFCLYWCTCSVVHDHWWERSVQFCLVPCNECRQCGIELSNHGPVSRGLPLNGSTAHKPTTTFVVDKQVSDLRCQLETYPWPSPINGGSSGCNLDFAIINTCQGNIISSKKTEHGSVLSSTEAVGDNWACQTHGDSSKLVQFEMETSHVHSKYLIILIKQALFFNSKHSCQVLNEN